MNIVVGWFLGAVVCLGSSRVTSLLLNMVCLVFIDLKLPSSLLRSK